MYQLPQGNLFEGYLLYVSPSEPSMNCEKIFLQQAHNICVICGIDLAGLESRPTGICILNEITEFSTVFTDTEILSLVHQSSPEVVAIDAPLSFHGEHYRDGDLELKKMYPILPLTFKGMQMLTQRGINLKSRVPYPVIEVYPHASKKILDIGTFEDLTQYGIESLPSTIHELDAAAAALTGKFFLEGNYRVYGKKDKIIVPRKEEPLSGHRRNPK